MLEINALKEAIIEYIEEHRFYNNLIIVDGLIKFIEDY